MSVASRSPVRERISERLTRERLGLEVRRSRGPFLIWLLLIAAAFGSFVLLLAELHLAPPWDRSYSLRIAAPNVTGVQPGEEVRIAGVQVGHITGVNLQGDTPVLSVSIDPGYAPVHRDARVEIRPNTPLQDMYVDIVSRGTRQSPALRSGAELAAARTESPVQFGQFVDIFNASVRPRVTATINALGQGLGDHGFALRQALVELAPFLEAARRFNREMAIRQLQTQRLVHNFALLSDELASRSTQLSGLIRDGATTMSGLASVEAPLGRLIDQLPPTLRLLPPALATVDAAGRRLAPAARALLPAATAMGPALNALTQLAPTAQRSLGALDRSLPGLTHLVTATRPLARGLNSAFGTLRPQAPELDRATAKVLPCETVVQKFFQWTLSVSKLSGLHGDMQRGVGLLGPQSVAGLPSSSVNTDNGILRIAPTCSGAPPGP